MVDRRSSGLHKLIVGAVAGAVVAGFIFHYAIQGEAAQPVQTIHASQALEFPVVIAAPGTVEPLSEEIKVGTALPGRLAEIRVEEGDPVEKGQVIAVIENDHLAARVAMAGAAVKAKEAELARLLNGARLQERRETAAAVDEASALLALARTNRDRLSSLAGSGYSSRERLDQAEREYDVAQARLAGTQERLELINAPAREDEVARAKAELALAKANLAEAQAIYEKSFVRAPIEGIVLRKYKKPGEVLPELIEAPILSLGDISTLRVRAEVDERDIASLRAGLAAYVTAPAFGTRRFSGRVVRIEQQLGRKAIRTDEPTERIDTKVLEALIELEPGAPLVTGLRVDAFIETGSASGPSGEDVRTSTTKLAGRGD